MKQLTAIGLKKSYLLGTQQIEVLRGIDLEVDAGESVAIMGPSGSGKTTLLQILGVMAKPDDGSLSIGGRNVLGLNDEALSRLRRRELGFIFQKFNLLSTLTAIENIIWPLLLDGRNKSEAEERARLLIEKVGLSPRAGHFPSELSGGEQQRVAIARAIIARPKIVFADEPTGALDSKSGKIVLELLKEIVLTENCSLIMVTHDPRAAATCDRTFHLADGRPA